MNHITQEQADKMARTSGCSTLPTTEPYYQFDGQQLTALCNAAIQHYIDSQPAQPLDLGKVVIGDTVNKLYEGSILEAANAKRGVRPAPAAVPRDAVPRDALVVNLMRIAGLDKQKAKECADVVASMIAAAPTGEKT